jgi:hypothetical protein
LALESFAMHVKITSQGWPWVDNAPNTSGDTRK